MKLTHLTTADQPSENIRFVKELCWLGHCSKCVIFSYSTTSHLPSSSLMYTLWDILASIRTHFSTPKWHLGWYNHIIMYYQITVKQFQFKIWVAIFSCNLHKRLCEFSCILHVVGIHRRKLLFRVIFYFRVSGMKGEYSCTCNRKRNDTMTLSQEALVSLVFDDSTTFSYIPLGFDFL